MKDVVFYPLVLLVVAALVGSSVLIGLNQPKCGPFGGANGPEDYQLIILKGQDLCRMEAYLGYELDLEGNVLTIKAEEDSNYPEADRNAHFRLGPDLETVYAGHRVRLTFSVRPSPQGGAEAFEFNYSTGNAGDTGWTRFELKPDWDTYTAEVNIPRKLLENATAFDYLSVRPVVPEKVRGIELREIQFRRLGQW